MIDLSIRGSWRLNEETGELEEQPRADYAAELEEQMRRIIRERDQRERDSFPGQRL